MKRIFVSAYTQLNLGDDLFIEILVNRYKNTKFVLHAPSSYKKIFKEHENINVVGRDQLHHRIKNYLFRKIWNSSLEEKLRRKSDAIVHIGGSVFMENNNWKKRQKIRVNRFGKPYFVIGANFGPYRHKEFYYSYKDIFTHYTDVCFRDEYSFNLFKDMDNIRLADDVVFNLPSVSKPEKKQVLISVIKPSFRNDLKEWDQKYYMQLVKLINKFTSKGYNVILMSFCKFEGDLEAIEYIYTLLSDKKQIEIYSYEGDIREALNKIAESKYIIATRFHAMILGWLFKKPTLPIAYSNKMTNVMKDVGYNGKYINFNNLEQLDFDQVNYDLNHNLLDVTKQIANSEKQFQALDKYLTDKSRESE